MHCWRARAAVPGKQSQIGSAQCQLWEPTAAGLGPPLWHWLLTSAGDSGLGSGVQLLPLFLLKVNSCPPLLHAPNTPLGVLLALSSCLWVLGDAELRWRAVGQTCFWGQVALWLLPTLGLCFGAPVDFLKLVLTRSSIYCELQRGLGMCVLDFVCRRLSCKLCSCCIANVLRPEMWASSSQPLLGSLEPCVVASSSEGTKLNPLWSKSAEMHVRSTCGGQKRDFLD